MFEVAFVNTTLVASAAVRLDLAADPWRTMNDSVFNAPQINHARASTMLSDGDLLSSSAYPNRIIVLSLMVNAGSASANAAQIQLLARELDRDQNILRLKIGNAQYAHFFTYRSSPGDIEIPTDGSYVKFSVEIEAEPFAYGDRVEIANVTVNNDPAAASNGMLLDIDSPQGDVATPANIHIPGADVGTHVVMFGSKVLSSESVQPPLLRQAEDMDLSTDATVGANTQASGSVVDVDFATDATMTQRLADGTRYPASNELRGTYRVLARVQSLSSNDIRMRFRYEYGSVVFTNDTVTIPATGSWEFVDLGDVQIPPSVPEFAGYSGLPVSARGLLPRVDAERVSGTGSLSVDYLFLMPADQLSLIDYPTAAPDEWRWDGANHVVYERYATGGSGGAHAKISGSPELLLHPGRHNRIYIAVSDDSPDANGSITVTVQYWPRFLHVVVP